MDRFPKVRIILDHFARVEAADGPPYAAAAPLFALAKYPNLYLKLTHRPLEQAVKGKATPETFFGKVVKEFGANRIVWGSNFPAAPQPLPRTDRDGAQRAFLPAAAGSGLDILQDRPDALSGAGEITIGSNAVLTSAKSETCTRCSAAIPTRSR